MPERPSDAEDACDDDDREQEAKFLKVDFAEVTARILDIRGVQPCKKVTIDTRYFEHPDARETLEEQGKTLRVRLVGDKPEITCKTDKRNGKHIRDCRELEAMLESAKDFERMIAILKEIGFEETDAIKKTRTGFMVVTRGTEIVKFDFDTIVEPVSLRPYLEIEAKAGKDKKEVIRRYATEVGLRMRDAVSCSMRQLVRDEKERLRKVERRQRKSA